VKVALLLHLYQPVYQDKAVFTEVYTSCYLPLLKFIKNKRDFNVTLNVSLSLLQQMDMYGYTSWVESLKELVTQDKVELTGSAAYHPLLTKLSEDYMNKQIVLNEYGVGYYLGRRSGFEGEPAILIKDLNGFFPPELAVSPAVLKTVNELNYKWMVVDECAISGEGLASGVYEIDGIETKIVARNTALSNAISFKRDSNVTDIVNMLEANLMDQKHNVIAIDGEVFGHHFKDGMYFLETFVEAVMARGGNFIKISPLVENSVINKIESIKESTWALTNASSEIYPLWQKNGNLLQKAQWDLFKVVNEEIVLEDIASMDMSLSTAPVWSTSDINAVEDPVLRNNMLKHISILQSQNSDQFWWASGETLPNDVVLSSTLMVRNSLEIYSNIIQYITEDTLKEKLQEKIKDVESCL